MILFKSTVQHYTSATHFLAHIYRTEQNRNFIKLY